MERFAHATALAVCLSSAAIAAQSPAPKTFAINETSAAVVSGIESLAAAEADANLLSGIILLARGDRIVFHRGYGFSSWELQAPVTFATRFGIGSITKVMTEMVVDMLVAEGRLDLDAPVSRYLESFPKGPKGGAVTIRHLVTHHSGVPHRVTSEMDETMPLHPADIVERVRAKELLFEPGSQELYSSAGFTSLARIVELIESKPFDVVLRDRIFRPASMVSTSGETGQQLMPQRALSYRLSAVGGGVVVAATQYKNLGFLTGAGSVYSTAEDLFRLARAMRKGVFGRAGQTRVGEVAGQTWRSWYGRTDGYETSVDVLPASDITFVFLSNLRSAANWQLRDQVKSLITSGKAAAISRPPAAAGAPSDKPDSFAGSYGDPSDPIVIRTIDGHFFRDESEFYPIAEGRYYIPASGSVMRFRRTSAGIVDALLTKSPWATEERINLKLPGH